MFELLCPDWLGQDCVEVLTAATPEDLDAVHQLHADALHVGWREHPAIAHARRLSSLAWPA